MLPTRATVWLFVGGLAFYFAAVIVAALAELFAGWFPGLAQFPLAAGALWLVVGFDACILVLFLIDGAYTYWTFRLQARRERPARLSLGAENEVVLVLDNASNRRLHVLCFDEVTGKKLWERQFVSTGNTNCHPKSCMAAPTPVTDGKVVFALFATGDLAAIERDGSLLWYRSLETDYPGIANQVGMAASPLLYDGTLIVPMDNSGDSFLAGLDARTGKNRWKVERVRDINWMTPVLHVQGGKTSVLFQTERAVTAYDPRTGKERWTAPTEKGSTIPSPVVGDDMVFAPGSPLVALKPGADGTTPQVVWSSNKLSSGFASPLLYGDRLYALTRTGVNCVRAKDGELLWQERIKGPFSASPVVADGKMYIVTEDGFVTVLKLGNKPEVLAVNEMDDVILATPAIANGCLYLRSDKYLYCIGEKK